MIATSKHLLLVLMLLALSATAVLAASPDSFQYSAEIQGLLNKGRLYRITLTDEVFRNCNAGCRDLRVLDDEGNEVPYVMLNDESRGKAETYNLKTVNYEEHPGAATLTLQMPQASKQINVIDLDIDAKDFKKSVALSCSNDLHEWSPVTESNIYDFSSQVDLRNTEISFGGKSCLYYKLKLIDYKPQSMLSEGINIKYKDLELNLDEVKGGKLRIDKIVGRTSGGQTSTVYDIAEFNNLSARTDDEGNTVVVFEARLPFNRMTFNITNSYFYRYAEIYFSDEGGDGPYSLITKAPIYRFPLSGTREEKTFVEYGSESHKYYRILIRNDGNPPLFVESVTLQRIRRNLFFISLDDADKYSLYFGNSLLDKQNYDLSKFIQQDNWSNNQFEVLKLSAVKRNANYIEPIRLDKQERAEKILLLAIVIGLVIAIGLWMYVLVRKTSRMDV